MFKSVQKKLLVTFLILTSGIFTNSFLCFAQTPPVLVFTPVVSSGFSQSLDVINAADGTNRLFVVERTGKVRIVSNGVLLPGSFIDIHDSLPPGSENGLLSMAFHPNYVNNGYFFIYYLNTNFDVRITRFKAAVPTSNNPVNQTTGVVLMTIPENNSYHNGGKLLFGPDGNLYFGTGDGSPGGDPNNQAQNGNLLVGKMIRINVDNFTTPPYYSIPADNPYVNNPSVRDEIFAIGMRNPWRWSFDRLTHDVWIADVGEAAWEEVNFRPFATSGGINYGWRCYEGNHDFVTAGCQPQSSYVSPIFEYPHNTATGGWAVTGGHVYRGTEYEALYGYYICSDYVTGNTWLIKPNGSGGWNISMQSSLPTSIVGFGESENGALYAVTLTGTLYKVTTNSGAPLPITILQFAAKAFNGYNYLQWETASELNLSHYEIEFSYDAVNYAIAGRINAFNLLTENNYSFQHFVPQFERLFYRIKATGKDGHTTYSTVIELSKKQFGSVKVYPAPVTGNQLKFVSEKPVEEIALFSADGKRVFERSLSNSAGTITVSIPYLQKGIYILRLKNKNDYLTERIIINQQ